MYLILQQVPHNPDDMVEYLEEVMYKNNIGPDAIADALGMIHRTVEKWFSKGKDGRRHLNNRGKTKIREIQRGIDAVLKSRGKGTVYPYREARDIEIRRYEVFEALSNSLKKIVRRINVRDLQTLEHVAWDMYQKQNKYPAFYDLGPDAHVDIVDTDEETGLQTASLSYRWIDDSSLYLHDRERDEAERAHAEAEALANETIETTPDDTSGGRWDVWEQTVHDERKQTLVDVWTTWADSRPADMPMTPEFRQLLAILELEAPRDDQPGEAPMDPELAQLSAILQAEALTDDQTADDAEEGAEPTQ